MPCSALLLILALIPPLLPAAAGETPAQVERRFDRSGDGVVDAEDWKRLSMRDRRAYAEAFLAAFAPVGRGVDPYRVTLYLNALNTLYHIE
ncbi:MAG: hypothetical protein D6682_00535 [Zetaproteobacteria bacterium]|nr:MAG: hypothetical protein D6682_00535 [Zetaproteobacteria bacterium]